MIVMAFNEREGLEQEVLSLSNVLSQEAIAYEIIIIDDGSTDGSGAVADRLASSLKSVTVIHHPENRGLGEVYRSGFRAAHGEYLSFFPADGQVNPESCVTFFRQRADADLILGYVNRRPEGWKARLLSGAERAYYALLLGHFPKFQGPFLLKTSLLRSLPLISSGRGWGIVMELIIRAYRGGFVILHSEVQLRQRNFGKSKVSKLKVIFSILLQVMQIRIALWKKRDTHLSFLP